MTTFFRYDEWGWYIGTVDFGHERSTPVAPTNRSLEETQNSLRSNWTGTAWRQLPYVPPPTESGEVLTQIVAKKETFEARVVEDRFQPIVFLGNTYETFPQKREEIISLLAIGLLPENFYWFDINDNPTSLDLDQMRILAATVVGRDMALYQKLGAKFMALDACTTLAEVESINWED